MELQEHHKLLLVPSWIPSTLSLMVGIHALNMFRKQSLESKHADWLKIVFV